MMCNWTLRAKAHGPRMVEYVWMLLLRNTYVIVVIFVRIVLPFGELSFAQVLAKLIVEMNKLQMKSAKIMRTPEWKRMIIHVPRQRL
jgi:hypothetical protein